MLDLAFYSRGKKPFGKEINYEWAKIFLDVDDYNDEFEMGDSENEFTNNDLIIKETPVFQSDSLYDDIPDKVYESIEIIVGEKSPEVILISTEEFFKNAVHFSMNTEMEPQMTISEKRDIVYYAMIGEEKSALLVAWNSFVEYEEPD